MNDGVCPLCDILNEKEVLFSNRQITIANARDRKGHAVRIMVISKRHVATVNEQFKKHALRMLVELGKAVFSYTPKFVVLDSTHGGIIDHWHLVASDIDLSADDFDQMLTMHWIQVVDTGKR
jgi:hypothetical protein